MLNKMKQGIMSLVVALLALLVGVSTVSQAQTKDPNDPETVDVTLHKQLFDDKLPTEISNTGEKMDFAGKPLKGVEFQVFDVTERYLELVQDKSKEVSQEDAIKQLINDINEQATVKDLQAQLGQPLKTVTTNDSGEAIFSKLKLIHNGQHIEYATYAFVETNSPTNVTQKATPLIINFPIYQVNATDEINTDIHLYPKNAMSEMINKDLDDVAKKALVTNGVNNAQIGQKFGYNISLNLPWNLKDKDYYRVTDTPNTGMKTYPDTIKIGNLDVNNDYTVTPKDDNGFIVTFNLASQKVKELAGKPVVINYQASLTKDAAFDVAINNKAFVEVGTIVEQDGKQVEKPETPTENEPGTPENPVTGPDIYTGGQRFNKISDESKKALSGAEFVLAKTKKDTLEIVEYAKIAEDGTVSWIAEQNQATKYTSDDKGAFFVTGLNYSSKLPEGVTYSLIETKAPEGYSLLKSPYEFEIIKGKPNDKTIFDVENVKKGILPSTGGLGVLLFVLIGGTLMAGAYLWLRRGPKKVRRI